MRGRSFNPRSQGFGEFADAARLQVAHGPAAAFGLGERGLLHALAGAGETQILVAERLAYFPPEQARDLLDRYRESERMLAGLTRSLDNR